MACLLGVGCAHPGLPSVLRSDWPESVRSALARGAYDEVEAGVRQLEASGQPVLASLVRVISAAQAHDPAAMRAALERPETQALRGDPTLRSALAQAIAGVLGLAAAAPDFQAICADPSAHPTDHQDACAGAALAALGPPASTSGDAGAELAFLPKLPIPIVIGALSGVEGAPLIIDTGAAGTALSKAFCESHHLPYLADKPQRSEDAGGAPVALWPMRLASLQVGGYLREGLPAVVIELPPNLKVGAILAPQRSFEGSLVELDFRQNRLRILREQRIEDWVKEVAEPVHQAALAWDGGNIFVRARIDDRLEGWMNFDSGAAGSILTLEAVERLGRTVDKSAASVSTSIEKHAAFPPFSAELQLGDGPADAVQLTPIERRPTVRALRPIGNLGVPWMRGRRIALAPDGRSIWYTAAHVGP